MNPPCSQVPQLVVELIDTNLMASELQNMIYNRFQVTFPEELHSGHPFLDQLAHPIQHEAGQSGIPYHEVISF
jgi:hypothetical protein